jgi:hypothetical protein
LKPHFQKPVFQEEDHSEAPNFANAVSSPFSASDHKISPQTVAVRPIHLKEPGGKENIFETQDTLSRKNPPTAYQRENGGRAGLNMRFMRSETVDPRKTVKKWINEKRKTLG